MKLALLGDVALIGAYDLEKGNEVFKKIESIRRLTKDCDVVLANLESPLTNKNHTFCCKGVYLRSNPINVELLKYMNVTHVTLANNHIFDYGLAGMRETKKVLEENGIGYVGLGNNPSYVEKDNSKVVIEGFCCYSANGLRYGHSNNHINTFDKFSVNKFLDEASNNKALPILSVHYGIERLHYPAKEHVDIFRTLAKNNKYILHGNHPHSIQGLEFYNESLLVYAQGNLCFDDCEITSIKEVAYQGDCDNYIVKIEINNNEIINYHTFPFTDKDSGALEYSTILEEELNEYSKALEKDYVNYRNIEISTKQDSCKHDVKFFVNRLNYKYIGAYIEGISHKKKYIKVIKQFNEL